jgi:hypothetical protein
VITIYYNDHSPPHFHAKYENAHAKFSIEDLSIIEGSLPKRAVSLILEWAFEHRDDLLKDWLLSKDRKPLKPIEPLR